MKWSELLERISRRRRRYAYRKSARLYGGLKAVENHINKAAKGNRKSLNILARVLIKYLPNKAKNMMAAKSIAVEVVTARQSGMSLRDIAAELKQ